jgi:CubicO group peptidase (beta-lactamase class C family)
VYNNGKVITRHHSENRNRPDDNTLYEIGSVTKTFTGLLIAKAVTEGKISLTDDVRKYLDGKYRNLEYKGKPITIKDLLVFKTGVKRDFPDYGTLLQKMDDNTAAKIKALEDAYTKKQFFDDLKKAKVETEPGTEYMHTKLGPELCAVVLEKVYGKSFETLMSDFLHSAGMESSKLFTKDGKVAITGTNENGKAMPLITDGLWGAAGMLKSTAADMVKYMRYQMDPKNAAATESHRELSDGFAYCWNITKDHEGKTGYWMHGGTFGTQNIVIIYPDYNLGISVMVNKSGADTFTALDEARGALEDEYKPGRKSAIREIRTKYGEDMVKALPYYAELKKTNKYFVDEDEINRYGYSVLANKKPEAALQIFSLYVIEFPKSANAYDSRGEAQFALKNYAASRKDYEKSLQLNPKNDNAKQMLEKLKGL